MATKTPDEKVLLVEETNLLEILHQLNQVQNEVGSFSKNLKQIEDKLSVLKDKK